ncbi:MAG: glycosyltransferase [Labilithrix sp.]|nr:glycosyltransferase [Labilithrix sp.]
MKILDVTEFYSERGGGVRSHLSLKSHVLCQLGHDHVVVAPGASDAAEDDGAAGARLARREGHARLVRIGGPSSPYDPTYHLLLRFDKIAAIVARERPDVLEIHSPYLAALGAMRADPAHFGVRTFQWHSDFIDTYAGVFEGKLASSERASLRPLARVVVPATRPLWSVVRGIGRRCDATLVAAAWQVEKLASHGVPRVHRVPFGIEHDVFRPDARSYETRRDLLALASHNARDDDAMILVGVGRFAIEKRWDVVIDAFARLRDEGRDVVLVLIGDGPERERMQARVAGTAAAAGLAMPGFVKDRARLAAMLASADALVHASPFETFGLSIAEAMSCGLPTIVPDRGGAAEMHVPDAGARYRSLDVDACARATASVLDRLARGEDVRAAAARAGRRLPSVRQQFEAQVALYESLLAVARGRQNAHDSRS